MSGEEDGFTIAVCWYQYGVAAIDAEAGGNSAGGSGWNHLELAGGDTGIQIFGDGIEVVIIQGTEGCNGISAEGISHDEGVVTEPGADFIITLTTIDNG